MFRLDNSVTSKTKYAAKLVVLLLDDVTPAVGGAADHLLPLPPSPLLPLLLLGCGPAGLVESNSALVAELRNVKSFTRSKSSKPNFTPRKARKSRQI